MTKSGGLIESSNWYETSLPVAERKKRGHFSTPPQLVAQILDACGYTSQANLSQLRVLDPACGSGNFLGGAAHRLLAFAKRNDLTQKEGVALLQRNLWGFDPDPVSCFMAEMQLRTILQSKSKDPAFLHIHQADGLTLPWEPCIDLLITNPPYLAAKNTDLTGYLSAQQRGQTDSYLLFLNLAFQAVRPNGWIGLVLPDPVLARANAAKERACLLKEFTLHHLWHLAGVFSAEVGAVILIAQKCPPKHMHQVCWKRERWQARVSSLPLEARQVQENEQLPEEADPSIRLSCPTVPQALFLQQPGAEFRYLLADERIETENSFSRTSPPAYRANRFSAPISIEQLRACLAETPIDSRRLAPLAEFLSISRGEELGRESTYLAPLQTRGNAHYTHYTYYSDKESTYLTKPQTFLRPDSTNNSSFVNDNDSSFSSSGNHLDTLNSAVESFPVLRGGVDIRPYITPTTTWGIACEAIKKPLERYFSPKLLVVKSTDRLQAAIDFQGYVALQTLYLLNLRTKDMGEDFLYYFLALLNSRLLRKYVYVLHTAYKWVQPQIEQSVLANLPVPLVEQGRQQEIIERAKAIILACSEDTAVVEWKEDITRIYEEQERAICALYDSALH